MTGSFVGATLSPCCLFLGSHAALSLLTPDPWPQSVSRQTPALSWQLPKPTDPQKQRGREREREKDEALTADLSWRGSSVYPARVAVYLFREVKKWDRNTDLIYEIWRAKLEERKKKEKGMWGLGGRRGEEVRNGMGGQTWVNLASERSHSAWGDRCLKISLHINGLYLLAHIRTHMHARCKPVLENSYTTGTWD